MARPRLSGVWAVATRPSEQVRFWRIVAEIAEPMGVGESVTLLKSERLVDDVAMEKMILLVAILSIIVVASKSSRTIPAARS
jgi:hypothetical protein